MADAVPERSKPVGPKPTEVQFENWNFPGIYMVKCTNCKMVYIGETRDIGQRLLQHRVITIIIAMRVLLWHS
jgi:hypothetical protein